MFEASSGTLGHLWILAVVAAAVGCIVAERVLGRLDQRPESINPFEVGLEHTVDLDKPAFAPRLRAILRRVRVRFERRRG